MIIGVIGFYFVVSNINSIISNSIKKQSLISLKKSFLYKINEKKKFKPKILEMISKQIDDYNEFHEWKEVKKFLNVFPKVYKRDLKYAFYKNLLRDFQFLKSFNKKIINSVGDCMTELSFYKSNH